MKSPFVKFGIIGGALIIVYTMVVFLFIGDFGSLTAESLKTVEALGYLRYLILLLAVLYALNFVKKSSEESLAYKKVFMGGFIVAVVIALCVGIMEAGYLWANPNFMEQYGKLYIESKQASGATEAEITEIKKQMEDYSWMQNPAAGGVFYFFETLLLGSVFSAIGSFFFRKK